MHPEPVPTTSFTVLAFATTNQALQERHESGRRIDSIDYFFALRKTFMHNPF